MTRPGEDLSWRASIAALQRVVVCGGYTGQRPAGDPPDASPGRSSASAAPPVESSPGANDAALDEPMSDADVARRALASTDPAVAAAGKAWLDIESHTGLSARDRDRLLANHMRVIAAGLIIKETHDHDH